MEPFTLFASEWVETLMGQDICKGDERKLLALSCYLHQLLLCNWTLYWPLGLFSAVGSSALDSSWIL